MTDAGRFDPVTLQILWSRLISIADEAAAALHRTSFSTIVRESNDFATVLMDAEGASLGRQLIFGGRVIIQATRGPGAPEAPEFPTRAPVTLP